MSLQQLASRLQENFATGFVKAVEWRGDLAVTVTPDSTRSHNSFTTTRPWTSITSCM